MIDKKLPKVGFITFGDHRPDMWEKVFSKKCIPLHKKAIDELKKLPIEVIYQEEVSRTREQIKSTVQYLESQQVDIIIAHIPCWTSPNLVVYGVQQMNKFPILLGNLNPGTHGCVGLLGASGALSQIGYKHKSIRVEYDSEIYKEKLLPVIGAATAVYRLKDSVFGLFGGRSIGIDTATYDPMQWKQLFGIDSEHLAQIEIVRLAKEISPQRITKMREWIENNAKSINYDDDAFTKAKFEFQIACYLATKDLVEEYHIDFMAIKCMHELSNSYVPQCMTQAFMGNFSDSEGQKLPVPTACEADADGALTQQILSLLSGNEPTFFADVSHIDNDRKIIYNVNCGAINVYYAGRNETTEENLKNIDFHKSVRPSGGGITRFYATPGEMQLARLYRRNGKYVMAIIPCEVVEPSQKMTDEFIEARGVHQLPVLFAKVNFDLDDFISKYGSNHISGVAGYYKNELIEFCNMTGIEYDLFEGEN